MERPDEQREFRFTDLNWLGKTVFLGGTAMRLTANALDATARRASQIASDSRKAFAEGRDANIEEARIIEERASDAA
ncbi:hypothetical protein [Salisaeta longa]|uniref:hypothetical protein n=1 Tax=Salisaeta longa TaxID=503170 RepID=UPI0003B54A32|nr:hypothetical protein [Salisaeta longa]